MNISENQQITEIVQLALATFQNAGIKRKIDKFQKFQSEVIYFQITKLIFPEIMSELIEIGQTKQITSSEKIQKLISIIEEIVRVNLDHIQGSQIIKGNKKHVKHLIQLLYALSQKILNPQNEQEDQQEYDDEKNQEIQEQIKQSQQIKNSQLNQKQLRRVDLPLKRETKEKVSIMKNQQQKIIQSTGPKLAQEDKQSQKMQKSQSESSGYLIPPLNNYPDSKGTSKKHELLQPKKQKIRNFKNKEVKQMPKAVINKKQLQKNKNQIYPLHQIKKSIKQQLKTFFIQKNFQTIQDLEQRKLMEQTRQFKKWADKQNINQNSIAKKINNQFFQRQSLIKINLQQRSKMIKDSTQNSQQYVKAMKNLFHEQKLIFKNIKKRKREKDIQNIKSLINSFKTEQKLLQKQILSSLMSKNNNDKQSKKIRI